MNGEKKTEIWHLFFSLLWRATILAPLFLLLFSVAVSAYLARFLLPLLIIPWAVAEDWGMVTVLALVWLLCLWTCRTPWLRKQFRAFPAAG